MIVTQIKQAIAQHKGISRKALAQQFLLSEDGVDAIVQFWIKRGEVSRLVDTNEANYVLRVRYVLNEPSALALNVVM